MSSKVKTRDAKTLFAKMLAHENISVVYDGNEETASFDINNRVLTIPILNDMQSYHHDGFIAHEVAHALYTPKEALNKDHYKDVEFSFINIVEDARIEKLVQNKYTGTKKDFYKMYEDFSNPTRNFFGIDGVNVDELTLIDKINLFYKIGRFQDVNFTDAEKPYVKMVSECVTFNDVVETARAIQDFMAKNNQKNPPSKGSGSSKNSSNQNEAGFTQKNFEENRKKFSTNPSSKGTYVGEMVDVEKMDVSDDVGKTMIDLTAYNSLKNKSYKTLSDYEMFQLHMKPIVTMMVNQFNMYKSAQSFKKTKVSRTGKLNMADISSYQITNDIFLSNEITQDEKNHGFVFFIDWSSSMSSYIKNTVKQMLVIVEFCRRLGIPYEAYGFTTSNYDYSGSNSPASKAKFGEITSSEGVVFKLLDSRDKKNVAQSMHKNLYNYAYTDVGQLKTMSMTPLYNTAVLSAAIMRQFKKRHGREKNILVLLSDGSPTDRLMAAHRSDQNSYIITDKYSQKNYKIETYHDVFKYVKDTEGVFKMIGFFLSDHANHLSSISPNGRLQDDKVKKSFEEKSYGVFENGIAFDKFFIIALNQFDISSKEKSSFESVDKWAGNDKVLSSYKKMMESMKKPMIFLKAMVNEIC